MATENAAIELAEEKARELEPITAEVLASAQTFEIITAEQYEQSAGLLRTIKGKQTELDELRKSITRPLDDAKAKVMALFKPATDRLDQAERTLKTGVVGYQRTQERLRRELEEEARAAAQREAEKLQRRADKAREKGQEDKADELEEQAATLPVPIVPSSAAQVSGVVVRTTWCAEVTDLAALIAAVALTAVGGEGGQPLLLLQPNMPVLHAQARALKGQLNIPGVRATTREGVAARGA